MSVFFTTAMALDIQLAFIPHLVCQGSPSVPSNYPKILSLKTQTPVITAADQKINKHKANLLNLYDQYLKPMIQRKKKHFKFRTNRHFRLKVHFTLLKVLRPSPRKAAPWLRSATRFQLLPSIPFFISPNISESLPFTRSSFLPSTVINRILQSSQEAKLKHSPSSKRLTSVLGKTLL